MGQKRLLELAAYSLSVGFAAAVPLCWRLRYLYEGIGIRGLRDDPLAVWLPIALVAAMATYVLVLASLVPQRLFFGTSILLLGMAAILAVMHHIFDDVGHDTSDMFTPFVVQLVTLGFLLAGARMLRFRLTKADSDAQLTLAPQWRYPISDLFLLVTALAVFLSTVHQFEYFWFRGSSRFQQFLWYTGLCLCLSSVTTVWAILSIRWRVWLLVAIVLAPLGAVPAWYVQNILVFPFYWHGLLTAMHAGFLMLLLWVLRMNRYELIRIPASVFETAEKRSGVR